MSDSDLYNSKHWRERAEQTRVKAEAAGRDVERERLQRIAAEYEKLAVIAERVNADRRAEEAS